MSGLKDITPGELRAMLREHAVVIAPGEVLCVMVPPSWAPDECRDLMTGLGAAAAEYGIPVLVTPGTAIGVKVMPPDPFGEGGIPEQGTGPQ